jgi:hypothetical protein
MAINILKYSTIPKANKYYPKLWFFWFENIPSGNPVPKRTKTEKDGASLKFENDAFFN